MWSFPYGAVEQFRNLKRIVYRFYITHKILRLYVKMMQYPVSKLVEMIVGLALTNKRRDSSKAKLIQKAQWQIIMIDRGT